jgi:hypothetical protein
MKANLGIPERRKTDRLRTNQLASYTRYDTLSQPGEQVIARLTEVGLGGVRIESGSPAQPGEMLDVTLAFGNNLVSFKGKAIHMTPSRDEGFDLGISIEDIEDQQRVALIRLLARIPNLAGS